MSTRPSATQSVDVKDRSKSLAFEFEFQVYSVAGEKSGAETPL